MDSTFQFIQTQCSQHWPFMAFAIVMMLVNQVVKTSIFTKCRAHKKSHYQWFWFWGYRTLPLHPVTVGSIIGAIWRNPEGAIPVWPLIASIFYFALAGTLSVWLYQLIKGLAKRRHIDLGNVFPNDED